MQCVVTEHEAPQSTDLRSLAIAHGLLDFVASGGSEQRSSSVENGSKMRHLLCVRNNQKWSSSGGSARSEAPEREKVAPSLGAGASAQAAGSSELGSELTSLREPPPRPPDPPGKVGQNVCSPRQSGHTFVPQAKWATPQKCPQAKWGRMSNPPGKVGQNVRSPRQSGTLFPGPR